VLLDEKLAQRSAELGAYFMKRLRELNNPNVKEIRGKGLLIAIELKEEAGSARRYVEALMHNGLLAKETHETVIRFAPPLTISKEEIDTAVEIIRESLIPLQIPV
jgi:ornithine--oxo-acid transaminase